MLSLGSNLSYILRWFTPFPAPSSPAAVVEHTRGVCASPMSQSAAFDLLVALCTNCVPNLKSVCEQLTQLFYRGEGKKKKERFLEIPPLMDV